MIKYMTGSIFNTEAEVLVNPVNTDGVMGAGLAAEFKGRYPRMFQKYEDACKKNALKTGMLMLVKDGDKRILLFPTKEHWKSASKLEYIDDGLRKFCDTYKERNIKSAAFPLLGCGLGGLDWRKVKPLMESYLGELDIDIYIYA